MGLLTQGRTAKQKALTVMGGEKPAQAQPQPQDKLGDTVDRVLKFVPVEVIGVYVGLMGAIAPEAPTSRWAIYGVALLLVPFFLWLGSATVRSKGWAGKPTRRLTYLSMIGAVAFTSWVLAMPGNPFAAWIADVTRWGTGALIVLAAVLPPLAKRLDLA